MPDEYKTMLAFNMMSIFRKVLVATASRFCRN